MKTTKRLTVDLPADMYIAIKARANMEDLSIKDFVIEAIVRVMENSSVSDQMRIAEKAFKDEVKRMRKDGFLKAKDLKKTKK
jgi:uncharacterized protein (DUF1778 family)